LNLLKRARARVCVCVLSNILIRKRNRIDSKLENWKCLEARSIAMKSLTRMVKYRSQTWMTLLFTSTTFF